MMIATSVLAIASCNKEMNEPAAKQTTKTIRLVANPVETKTTFGTPDGTTYPVYWNDGDKVQFKIASSTAAAVEVEAQPSADKRSATFELSFPTPFNLPYIFRGISPASAYVNFANKMWTLNIQAEQTPTATSVDPAAQILVASKPFDKEVVTTPEELPDAIELDFKHVTAYGKFSITNCAASSVSLVKLTFAKPIVGLYTYNDGIDYQTGLWPNDAVLTPTAATKSITINTTSLQDIWFACAPAEVAGTQLKIEVVSGEQAYVKTITLGSTNNMVAGRIASFSVNFSGITPTAYVPSGDIVYSLVTSVDDLSSDDEVIMANQTYQVAVSATQASTNRAAVSVTIENNKITNPDATMQVFIIGKSGDTFCFKNQAGNYYGVSKDAQGKYYFRQISSADAAYHNVSIDSTTGDATIEIDNYYLMYNPGKAFNAFASTALSGKANVQFYKKVE